MKKEHKAILKRITEEQAPLKNLHAELFPEEYDFMGDSFLDASERKKGINPMSKSYQIEVNERRAKMGVKPFSVTPDEQVVDDGLIDSWEYCRNLLKQQS